MQNSKVAFFKKTATILQHVTLQEKVEIIQKSGFCKKRVMICITINKCKSLHLHPILSVYSCVCSWGPFYVTLPRAPFSLSPPMSSYTFMLQFQTGSKFLFRFWTSSSEPPWTKTKPPVEADEHCLIKNDNSELHVYQTA